MKEQTQPNNEAIENELVITRLIDVPRERLFEGWTDPVLLRQWFAPLPLTTTECAVDARPGGAMHIVMHTPDGQNYPTDGVFLEVSAPERLVFTDAYTAGWVPSPGHFFTAVVTFEEEDGQTRYTARARHWTREARDRHEAMGFEKGWNQCLDQLIATVTQK